MINHLFMATLICLVLQSMLKLTFKNSIAIANRDGINYRNQMISKQNLNVNKRMFFIDNKY